MSDRIPDLSSFTSRRTEHFPGTQSLQPWELMRDIAAVVQEMASKASTQFDIEGDIAIHKSAIVERGVVLKGPIVISEGVFIGAHAYLRGGVFLGPRVSAGPGCEIKSSIILDGTALAHFNFIGDSLIGSDVNFEAGSIVANYHNDRADKTIFVNVNGSLIKTGAAKFGALVGDGCRIGANAVLSPGTILPPNTIVKRLELVRQDDLPGRSS